MVYYFFASKSAKLQNVWLLLSSFFFYGYSEWRMLPLLIISIIVFYGFGLAIGYYNVKDEKKASWITTLGVLLGIGVLLYFKYLNFFIESFSNFFNVIGLKTNVHTFSIIMPLGISFFTFKLISYVIEVHRQHISPCKDLVAFGTYIAFFPTILSGPIDRPQKFLPQLDYVKKWDTANLTEGLQQILWGMFKKMVIADNLYLVVNDTWTNDALSGSTYFLGMCLYSIQMYTDFSGYSDMAIGVGKLLGIKIAVNFKNPFFSRNVAEYWRGWHMSLTTWLTDYVFTPLNIAFRDYGKFGMSIAIIINLVLIGMWHGANLTFAIFGLYHGLLFVPLIYSGVFMKKQKLQTGFWDLPRFKDSIKMLFTFLLVSIGLVIFYAPSIKDACDFFVNMYNNNVFSMPKFIGMNNAVFIVTIPFIIVTFLSEWKTRRKECPLFFENGNSLISVLSYLFLVASIWFLGTDSASFIYFKF